MEGRRKAMTYRLLAVNTFVWTTTALQSKFYALNIALVHKKVN